MTPEQIADVLDDAADYIESKGWRQDGPVGPEGGVCALTALCLNAPTRDEGGRVSVSAAYRALLEAAGQTDIIRWNDAPGRTKQDVLDAFRAAAKQQRSLP